MIKLFEWLFYGHTHQWEIIKNQKIHSRYNGELVYIKDEYTLQCKHCGNIKFKEN